MDLRTRQPPASAPCESWSSSPAGPRVRGSRSRLVSSRPQWTRETCNLSQDLSAAERCLRWRDAVYRVADVESESRRGRSSCAQSSKKRSRSPSHSAGGPSSWHSLARTSRARSRITSGPTATVEHLWSFGFRRFVQDGRRRGVCGAHSAAGGAFVEELRLLGRLRRRRLITIP